MAGKENRREPTGDGHLNRRQQLSAELDQRRALELEPSLVTGH